MTRRDWVVLLLITLVATGLRFYQLGATPPGFQFDEAFNAIDATQIAAGNRPLFMPANGGREVLYSYFQAGLGLLFGFQVFTLRMASAILGTLAVPALYLLVRRLFRRNSQWLAALTALALAVSYWHIHFSHYGIRVITMPLLYCGVFGFFWLGLHGGSRRARLAALVVGGALAGVSVWTNPTGRFVPFVVGAYALWVFWRYPAQRRLRLDSALGGLLLYGAVAFLVFLPLGLEFWRHPEFFTGHAAEVSVFAARVSGEAPPWVLLLQNAARVAGMFSFVGDADWTHGMSGRPLLDWFIAIPFYIGIILWAARLLGRYGPQPDPDRDALFLFFLWGLVMLAPSILSEAAPNYSRTLPAVPTVALAAGLGLTWVATRPRLQPRWGPALALSLVLGSGIATTYDYFNRFANTEEVYYFYDADKLDAMAWLKAQAETHTVYLSPLWSEHATVIATRGAAVRSLNVDETMVLPPPGQGAVFAFPAEQVDYAEDVAELWDATQRWVTDRYGKPLLAVVQLTADQAASWPPNLAPAQLTTARFDDAPTLLGLKVAENGRDLLLYWQSEAHTFRDLTSFVHLLDSRNRRVGQVDRVPGDGFFRTPYWLPQERVIQQYTPETLDMCSGGEAVRVVTGWYQYLADGQRRPRLDAPGDVALAGVYTLPLTSGPAASFQPPMSTAQALDTGLVLRGYGLDGEFQPGAPVTVDLYLEGGPEQGAKPAQLLLVDGAGATQTLWAGPLAPAAQWNESEWLCRRLHLRLPDELAPGEYALQLQTGAAAHPVTTLVVEPSTRQYTLPTLQHEVGATLGETIRLAGFNTQVEPERLTVTLVWQALGAPEVDAKVFVHLLNADGAIVAQSDALPAGSAHPNAWVEGEVTVDPHGLQLPPELPPGDYTLLAGMYGPITGQRLVATGAAGQRFAGDAVQLGVQTLPAQRLPAP